MYSYIPTGVANLLSLPYIRFNALLDYLLVNPILHTWSLRPNPK